ncbi:transposable element Tc1 transposase [Trichonephila clavipes]|uniref:Transposable element Tc1 transposase n=1 Tax=Trichonephila clavipes TaxID=2585209 RepID=A0A8X6VKE1_TRICX|nr:transposable element Tc1 transposase [Trichonephila clavipes]
MILLSHEVDREEHCVLAENALGNNTNRKETHKQVQRDEPTATTLEANTYAGKTSCIICDGPHSSQDCRKISKKVLRRFRKSEVMRRRCCLVCHKPGHIVKKKMSQ